MLHAGIEFLEGHIRSRRRDQDELRRRSGRSVTRRVASLPWSATRPAEVGRQREALRKWGNPISDVRAPQRNSRDPYPG